MSKQFHVHLVSDSTGETLGVIAKAALAQFEGMDVEEHSYVLVR
ncbi:MAG: kinase/pyrophosphorylase, partial [Alphaproteobacteria bacterium]|nr:kinase/pyrophosphorylase [Alphaproteobacteria bacterium]